MNQPVTYEIDVDRKVVTITAHQDPTIQEWREALDSILADPHYEAGFGFLSDRRAVAEPPSSAFVSLAASHLNRHKDDLAGSRWAVLIDSAVDYGVAQVGIAQIDRESSLKVEIFGDKDAAIAWLMEPYSAR